MYPAYTIQLSIVTWTRDEAENVITAAQVIPGFVGIL